MRRAAIAGLALAAALLVAGSISYRPSTVDTDTHFLPQAAGRAPPQSVVNPPPADDQGCSLSFQLPCVLE